MTATLDYINAPTVFRHVKRESWGIGQVMSEGPFRRRLQFEDGQTRTFKRAYYHLLEPVEAPTAESKATLDALVDEARVAMGAHSKRRRRGSTPITVDIDSQLEAFRADFPGGFMDPSWKSDVRGVGQSRALKRHRDPVLEAGPALLGEALAGRVERDGAPAVFGEVMDLLKRTDLVVLKSDVKPLEGLNADGRERFLTALVELVADPEATLTFDRFLGTLNELGVPATWSLVSALLTLGDPQRFGPVRASSLRTQAKRLGLDTSLPNRPTGQGYQTTQFILRRMREQLVQRELTPLDMVDVADMVARTHKA